MVKPSEGYESRSSGSLVRIEPVHWDGQGRVSVIGEIDLSNVRDVEAALSGMVCRAKPLTLDLIGLSYLDSQGVAMLYPTRGTARREGGSLTLANPQGIVRRVIGSCISKTPSRSSTTCRSPRARSGPCIARTEGSVRDSSSRRKADAVITLVYSGGSAYATSSPTSG